MFYKESIENTTLDLLTKLMSDAQHNEMLRGYELKYNSNPVIPIKALTWFDDINFNEPIMMSDRKPLNWKKIETRLNQMLKYPNKLFSQIQ